MKGGKVVPLEEQLNELSFNPNALESECTRHIPLLEKYTRLVAKAEQIHSRAEEEAKTEKARLILKASADSSLLPGNATVATIDAWCRTRKSYIAAVEAENVAQYRLTILENAINILYHRKDMLGNLVRMRLSGLNGVDGGVQEGFAGTRTAIRDMNREQVTSKTKKRLNGKE